MRRAIIEQPPSNRPTVWQKDLPQRVTDYTDHTQLLSACLQLDATALTIVICQEVEWSIGQRMQQQHCYVCLLLNVGQHGATMQSSLVSWLDSRQ